MSSATATTATTARVLGRGGRWHYLKVEFTPPANPNDPDDQPGLKKVEVEWASRTRAVNIGRLSYPFLAQVYDRALEVLHGC